MAEVKYNELINKINTLCLTEDNTYVLGKYRFSINNVDRNLVKLVNNSSADDMEMILSSLLYNSHKSIEDMHDINSLLNK
jgi:hypothetical protein